MLLDRSIKQKVNIIQKKYYCFALSNRKANIEQIHIYII